MHHYNYLTRDLGTSIVLLFFFLIPTFAADHHNVDATDNKSVLDFEEYLITCSRTPSTAEKGDADQSCRDYPAEVFSIFKDDSAEDTSNPGSGDFEIGQTKYIYIKVLGDVCCGEIMLNPKTASTCDYDTRIPGPQCSSTDPCTNSTCSINDAGSWDPSCSSILTCSDATVNTTSANGHTIVFHGYETDLSDPNITYWYYEITSSSTGNAISHLTFGLINCLLCPSEILPVSFESFRAEANNRDVSLSWITASETNNYGFYIERSSGYDDFVELGFVNGQGNSSKRTKYNFIDYSFKTSNEYSYRLKQEDIDGNMSYSSVEVVRIDQQMEFTVYPNPSSGLVTLTIPDKSQNNSIRVFNHSGLVLKNYSEINNQNTFDIDMSEFINGIYFVQLNNDKTSNVQRIVISK